MAVAVDGGLTAGGGTLPGRPAQPVRRGECVHRRADAALRMRTGSNAERNFAIPYLSTQITHFKASHPGLTARYA